MTKPDVASIRTRMANPRCPICGDDLTGAEGHSVYSRGFGIDRGETGHVYLRDRATPEETQALLDYIEALDAPQGVENAPHAD